MKIEYPKDPKSFKTATGTLWKYGNVLIDYENGYQIGWSVYIALADRKPWWCPRWLIEKIKKLILVVYVRDFKVCARKMEGK